MSTTVGLLVLTLAGNVNAQAFVNDDDGLLDVGEHPRFPEDPATAIETLSFRDSDIEDLDGANLLTGLQLLNLTLNSITSIEQGDFVGLENLQTLFLGGNEISSIEQGDFDGLDSLRTLTFWGNPITTIEQGAFRGLNELRFLGMGGRLKDIDTGLFDGLSNLQRLAVSADLESIAREDFDGLSGLKELDLSSNQITRLGDALGNLPRLELLDLGYNDITSIERENFDGLANLHTLDLSRNDISSIQSGAFQFLPKLEFLDLGGNSMTSIEPADLDGLSQLSHLDLAANRISHITPGTFAGMEGLETLILSLNELTELDFTGASFDSLQPARYDGALPTPAGGFHAEYAPQFLPGQILSLVLDDATLSRQSFGVIVAEMVAITDASVVGLTFSDAEPNDLSSLLGISSLDHIRIDPALFNLYADEFTAFAAIPGNTVTIVPERSTALLLAVGLAVTLCRRRPK